MSSTPVAAPPLSAGVRLQLSIMMFFQFAVWGAWFPGLGIYLGKIGLSDSIGTMYGTMALGTIFAPLIVGQIADRWFASEKLMAVLHLVGAGLLYLLATLPAVSATNPVDAATAKFWYLALAYALVYSPTLALSNSIAFTHVPDATRDFPGIRVLGTIGWIASGLTVGTVMAWFMTAPVDANPPAAAAQVATAAPATTAPATTAPAATAPAATAPATTDPTAASSVPATTAPAGGAAMEAKPAPVTMIKPVETNAPFYLAAVLSVVLGVLSLMLPHTPPTGKAGDALPFLKALGLFKDPSFAVFFGVSFIITIVLAFYYNFTGNYLAWQKVDAPTSWMTLGQWSEMLLLPLLPFFLRKWGMKTVLAVGMLAWGLRYGVFAWGGTLPAGELQMLVIASLAFHGICYDFFFAAGFIHVDNESPTDIRGSAQALFTFLTYGVGMWLGSELSGAIFKAYTVKGVDGAPDVTNWGMFWAYPSVGVLVALVIFLVAFRLPHKKPHAAA